MKKNIIAVISIILGLYISANAYSQTQYLSAGEKTGIVLDSLLKIIPVHTVEIRYNKMNESNISSITDVISDNFIVSGQFIIVRSGRKNLDHYYNLEKLISFQFADDRLIIYMELY